MTPSSSASSSGKYRLAALGLAATLCGALSAPAAADSPIEPLPRVAYEVHGERTTPPPGDTVEEFADIFSVRSDGRARARLTASRFAVQPAWSPLDRIAFTGEGRSEVRSIDENGGDDRRLSDTGFSPAWSPDGRRIVFSSATSRGANLFIANADGSNPRRLTYRGGDEPAWSPDGRRIAFVRIVSGNRDVHLIDVGSGKVERLTYAQNRDTDPAWSPSGRYLAFARSDSSGRQDLHVIRASGSTPRQITFGGTGYEPSWARVPAAPGSYLEERIAFSRRTRSAGREIYSMRPDRSGLKRLTNESVDALEPSWEP